MNMLEFFSITIKDFFSMLFLSDHNFFSMLFLISLLARSHNQAYHITLSQKTETRKLEFELLRLIALSVSPFALQCADSTGPTIFWPEFSKEARTRTQDIISP